MTALLPLDDALAIIARVVRPITDYATRALEDALNAITAAPVMAPYGLPPFTNTSVDGYAFRYQQDQTQFKIVGTSFAGEPFTGELVPGVAVRIATGGVLPGGADTVVMQEQCKIHDDQLIVQSLPARGTHIRHAGADIAAGAAALPAGHQLRPQDIALLGALGLQEVITLRKLRIAIASTGHELVPLGRKLAPGQIIDTNSLMLRQLLANADVEITLLNALPDDNDQTANALTQAAAGHDLIITTGGVSVGDRDYVRDVIHNQGQVHFWKLAIRPGKPVLFGQLGNCLTLGLPGNPVSALVTFCLILKPLLAALRGGKPILSPTYLLPLAAPFLKDYPLRSFPRARLIQRNDQWCAEPFHDQSSNLFTSLTQSDGLLDLPLEPRHYALGDLVLFRSFTGLL